jgi:hypothetical protein
LLEKRGEVDFKTRFRAVERLEEGEGRCEAGPLHKVREGRSPFAQVFWHSCENDPGKNRRSDQTEDGQCNERVRHAGVRIPARNVGCDERKDIRNRRLRQDSLADLRVAT